MKIAMIGSGAAGGQPNLQPGAVGSADPMPVQKR